MMDISEAMMRWWWEGMGVSNELYVYSAINIPVLIHGSNLLTDTDSFVFKYPAFESSRWGIVAHEQSSGYSI